MSREVRAATEAMPDVRNRNRMKKRLQCDAIWNGSGLLVEGLFSAYLGVWFNVGIDIAVLALFSFPLIRSIE